MTETNLPRLVTPKDEAFARPITNQTGSDGLYCFQDSHTGEFRIADPKNQDAFIESDNSVDLMDWK